MDRRFFSLGLSLWGLLSAGASIACIGTVTGFGGNLWWPFELASHFRSQYFVVLAGSALAYSLAKRYGAALIAAAFAFINLCLIVPLYFGASIGDDRAATLRAVLMNVDRDNKEYHKVEQFVRSASPDFMIIDEVTGRWLDKLPKMLVDYPFSKSLQREDEFGIALFSQIPLDHCKIVKIGNLGFPAVKAAMVIHGKRLAVIGVHPPPPVLDVYREDRTRILQELSTMVSAVGEPVMVLGDLNTTSWSPLFQELLRRTGLRDSRQGFGIQPTWPAMIPHMWIPLDHCLISRGVTVHNRHVGPNIGSDHYPVIVDFSLD